jgi:hypothetical protein
MANSMAHIGTVGRLRLSKRVGVALGTSAIGLMVVLPVALNGLPGPNGTTPGPQMYSAFTLPPTMTEGDTATTTTLLLTAPATEKATPLVRAPHK